MSKLTTEQLQTLANARGIAAKIETLTARLDSTVAPIYRQLIRDIEAAGDDERYAFESALFSFPQGLHRSELRTAIYRRYGR